MSKLAPEWVRTNDPVIRSPARYRWTTAPASIYIRLNIGYFMSRTEHVIFGHLYVVLIYNQLVNKIKDTSHVSNYCPLFFSRPSPGEVSD